MISTALLDDTWIAPDGTRARVVLPDDEMLEAVEDGWRSERSGAGSHWDWRRITATTNETFAIVAGSEVVALWAGETRLRRISTLDCYRVEFLEVAPARRGRRVWGLLAMVLIALRANELGAQGLVFGALPERAAWYERLGARRLPKSAWKGRRERSDCRSWASRSRGCSRQDVDRKLGKAFQELLAGAGDPGGGRLIAGDASVRRTSTRRRVEQAKKKPGTRALRMPKKVASASTTVKKQAKAASSTPRAAGPKKSASRRRGASTRG